MDPKVNIWHSWIELTTITTLLRIIINLLVLYYKSFATVPATETIVMDMDLILTLIILKATCYFMFSSLLKLIKKLFSGIVGL